MLCFKSVCELLTVNICVNDLMSQVSHFEGAVTLWDVVLQVSVHY